MKHTKYIFAFLVILVLVLPVNAILNCQCVVPNKHPYCITFGLTTSCPDEDRIPYNPEKYIFIESYYEDGTKEYPIKWDFDNPSASGEGWYYYVSPTRPFYLPYNSIATIR